jgi:hypothetical protein
MPEIFISDTPDLEKKEDKNLEKAERKIKNEDHDPHHHHGKFSSFRLYPRDIDFETRSDDEKVVLLLRQHFIVNLKWIFIAILMSLVPGTVSMFGILSSLPSGFEIVINIVWYLVTMAYVLENFLSWYFNVYIVTNERIIDVDFNNLIYKRISDATLDNIQDITYNMGGVVRTVFNYGDILIQTASEVSEFDFLAVPEPDKVVKIINDLVPQVK